MMMAMFECIEACIRECTCIIHDNAYVKALKHASFCLPLPVQITERLRRHTVTLQSSIAFLSGFDPRECLESIRYEIQVQEHVSEFDWDNSNQVSCSTLLTTGVSSNSIWPAAVLFVPKAKKDMVQKKHWPVAQN